MKREHEEDPANPYTAERLREIMFSLLPMNNLDTRDISFSLGKRTSFTDQLFTDRDDDPTDRF